VLPYLLQETGGGPTGEKPQAFFWRGFVSPVGSARPKERFFFCEAQAVQWGCFEAVPLQWWEGKGGPFNASPQLPLSWGEKVLKMVKKVTKRLANKKLRYQGAFLGIID